MQPSKHRVHETSDAMRFGNGVFHFVLRDSTRTGVSISCSDGYRISTWDDSRIGIEVEQQTPALGVDLCKALDYLASSRRL